MARRALLSTLGDVDIRLLRIFVVVAECNGIAASEMELNIGKSTISKHISDLEKRLGLRLCNRGPSGFALTSEGRQVLGYTRDLLARIDDFQSRVDGVRKTLTGTIRLGIFDQSSTNPNARLHAAISKFDEIAKGVSINISLDTPSVLEARVIEGALDLAIVPIYRPSSTLRYERLYSEEMSLYCGVGHPLFGVDTDKMTPKPHLGRFKYAGYGFNSPNMRAGGDIGVERAAEVREEEALVLLVQSGKYLGYLADHVAETLGLGNDIWPVFRSETAYAVEFAAILRRRPEPDRKTRAFLDCLIKAHMPKV